MRVITKRIKIIVMTKDEIRLFHELMERAKEGVTANYAEEVMDDGTYLGVSIVPDPIRAARHPIFNSKDS